LQLAQREQAQQQLAQPQLAQPQLVLEFQQPVLVLPQLGRRRPHHQR
jgi:hypothetical protein